MTDVWMTACTEALLSWLWRVNSQALWLLPVALLVTHRFERILHPKLLSMLWILLAVQMLVPLTWTTPWSLGAVVHAHTDALAGQARSWVAASGAVAWQLVLAIWCAGVVTLWLQLWHRARMHHRWVEHLHHDGAPLSQLAQRLQRCMQRVGLHRAPRIRCVHAAVSPHVFGLGRGTLVLPIDALQGWDRDTLDAVLMHELMHLKRRDTWLQWAHEMLCALHWFNPLVRWLAVRAHSSREVCCDLDVMNRWRSSNRLYRRVLLQQALDQTESQPPSSAQVHRHGQLMQRMRALHRWHSQPVLPQWQALLWLLFLMTCILPIGRGGQAQSLGSQRALMQRVAEQGLANAPGHGSLHVQYAVRQYQVMQSNTDAVSD